VGGLVAQQRASGSRVFVRRLRRRRSLVRAVAMRAAAAGHCQLGGALLTERRLALRAAQPA
jgi:hypothetical protein